MNNENLAKDQFEIIGTFRYKYKKLLELSKSDDINDLTECGGIVRDLIISDGNGLIGLLYREIPQLKTKKSSKLRFYAAMHTTSFIDSANRATWFVGDGLSPDGDHPNSIATKNYNRDEFLKLPVMCNDDKTFTIKDTVLFVANKLGARHWSRDKKSSNTDPMLFEIHEQFRVGGASPFIQTMRGISTIVASTMESVDNKIESRLNV